jgi:hypothetical protein
MPRYCPKIGHDLIPPHRLQIVIYQASHILKSESLSYWRHRTIYVFVSSRSLRSRLWEFFRGAYSFDELTQMAAMCSILCHVKDKVQPNLIYYFIITEIGVNKKREEARKEKRNIRRVLVGDREKLNLRRTSRILSASKS